MENFGLKVTICDFLSYLVPGALFNICVFLCIYFMKCDFPIHLAVEKLFGDELRNLSPNLGETLLFIFISYVIGVIMSTLSSFIIEYIMIGNVPYLRRRFSFCNVLSSNTYELFKNKVMEEFSIVFVESDMRIIITFVENKAPSSYGTALIFLALYGANRNTSMVFSFLGVASIVLYCLYRNTNSVIYGLVLMVLSIILFEGYVKFHKYFTKQIISAYITTK